MSVKSANSNTSSKSGGSQGISSIGGEVIEDDGTSPDFIYGGPFIKLKKIEPFIDTTCPINIEQQGTFKKSQAYSSMKDRLPILLTRLIDKLSKSGGGAYVTYISKLKNDIMTNKEYDLLEGKTKEDKRWNEWIEKQKDKHYFTNSWVFTECYVFRRLREGAVIHKGKDYDPFEDQKRKSFTDSLEPMCVVAEKLITMLPVAEKDKRKQDFMTLLKICLWANKQDLALPMADAEQGEMKPAADPFQEILDRKDKLIVDDSGKAHDAIVTKAETVAKALEAITSFKFQCSCHRLATLAGMPLAKEPGSSLAPSKASSKTSQPPAPPSVPPGAPPGEGEGEDAPKIPCPAKMVLPQSVYFDIVCDNAGYELFTDLCFAHFLIAQEIVQKVRFHLKKIPWFVSDATPKDFKYVVSSCCGASYNREIPAEPKPEPTDGSEPPPPEPPRVISADGLKQVGQQWQQYIDDGVFIIMSDDFWTSPIVYRDMKAQDYNMYRKLQYAVGVMFKGDLNYRKLLGDRNCVNTAGFEASLQGFIPAPILAVRTVKCEIICGLPKGAFDKISKIDEKWMTTNEYGVIQFCAKAEPLKIADKPCIDYGDTCFSTVCPLHTDM